jgi:NAD(P)-dependent dehydrogenase (short-subunit alcohol dehydrogenase family)
MGRLNQKTFLITGGSSGIGLAAARTLAQAGARVIINGRSTEALSRALAVLPADVTGIAADVGSLKDIDRLMAAVADTVEGLDGLVLCAGASRVSPLAQVTPDDFDQVFNVNVRGAFFCVQKAQPLLRAGGSVVLIGSGATELGRVGRGLYAASKAAVRQLGRSLAAELTLQGVRVNVVSPGPILTPFNIPAGKTAEQQAEVLGKMVPLGRVGTPQDVANAIAFLLSDEAAFIHGVELPVDGGWVQLHDVPQGPAS